jgi:hypothetical protein
MAGTDLYKLLLEVNPQLRAIMLSAEAKADDVGQAFAIGYASYLKKSKIADLPTVVLKEYTRFEVDRTAAARQRTGSDLTSTRPSLRSLLSTRIRYQLVSSQVLNENFVFQDSWKTVKDLHAGQSEVAEESVEISHDIVLSETKGEKLSADLSLDSKALKALKVALSGQLTSEVKSTVSEKQSYKASRKVEYKLPAQPDDPDKIYIAKRHYETARVFAETRCVILRCCSACTAHTPLSVVVYVPTVRVASRQRDYLSDGTVKVIDTGIHEYV